MRFSQAGGASTIRGASEGFAHSSAFEALARAGFVARGSRLR